MDKIIAAGPDSVPVLIGMLTDAGMAKQRSYHLLLAGDGNRRHCLLSAGGLVSKLGLDKGHDSWRSLERHSGPEDNLPAWEQLHSFIRKHGRRAIQLKWQAQWEKYKDRIFWDPKERCFKLKTV